MEHIAGINEIIRWGLIGLTFAALLLLIVTAWIRGKSSGSSHRHLWRWIERHLPLLFGVAWVYAFVTYFIGSYVGSTDFRGSLLSALSVVPMSIIHATETFLGMSDISAIHEDRHNSWIYMAFFDTSHFFSLMVSLCFVVKHLGYYAKTKFLFWKEKTFGTFHKNIYVFWGVNEATYSLATSVAAHYGGQGDFLIVFVKSPLEEQHNNQRMGFDRILNFVSMREDEMQKLDRLPNTIIVNSRHRLSSVALTDDETPASILNERLQLTSLKHILTKKDKSTGDLPHVHLFLFDGEQDANIRATTSIVREASLKNNQTDIYCLARRSPKTAWMEHYELLHPKNKTAIHIVDRSALAVDQLKSDANCHPCNFVKWDKETLTPLTTLTSLIIGFNDTGMEALNFIYEFGSFVNTDDRRAKGEYIVIDKDMDQKRGEFYANRPALKGNDEIKLITSTIGDDHYWNIISEILPRLNYVVIAISDDDKAIDAASALCRMAYSCKQRRHNTRLTVFVRISDSKNIGKMQNTARDINRLCGGSIGIKIFGTTEKMFTYDIVIAERTRHEAMVYNFYYQNIGQTPTPAITPESLIDTWRHGLGIGSKPTSDLTLADILDIERKRDQNIGDSLHKATKLRILSICGISNPTNQERWQLAKIEHERWVAYSRMNGWQTMSYDEGMALAHDRNPQATQPVTRDTLTKRHCDICPWNEIRAWSTEEQRATQGYDLRVVDTTLLIASREEAKH